MNCFSHIQKWMPMQKTILYQLNTYCINSYIDCHSYLYTFNNFSSFWHISDKLFWVSFFEQITWITNRNLINSSATLLSSLPSLWNLLTSEILIISIPVNHLLFRGMTHHLEFWFSTFTYLQQSRNSENF